MQIDLQAYNSIVIPKGTCGKYIFCYRSREKFGKSTQVNMERFNNKNLCFSDLLFITLLHTSKSLLPKGREKSSFGMTVWFVYQYFISIKLFL